MRLRVSRCLLPSVAACLFLAIPSASKTAEIERVKFETVDQVEIHGTYYGSDKGTKAPCVLMLHAIGGNSQQEGWDDLAKKLQAKGFAVLTFDFRGHGDSTSVGPNFWTAPGNTTIKRPKQKDTLSYKDFTNSLNYANMVQDIAAAKRYLDKRNDASDCNSGNVIVIGAESGATLGALWITTEWHRRRMSTNLIPTARDLQLEGQDIAAGVWLSIAQSLPRWTSPRIADWVGPLKDKVPMYFLYGAQDKKAATFADHMVNKVLKERDKKTKLPTGKLGITGTKLAGAELLGKRSLDTADKIVKYCATVMEDRPSNPWTKRDIDRTLLIRVPVESLAR
jgi:pimeloyl-ACP methyl ester carboxylesterase